MSLWLVEQTDMVKRNCFTRLMNMSGSIIERRYTSDLFI